MIRNSFRSTLLAILAAASASGCCESRIVEQVVPLEEDAGVEPDGNGCEAYCERRVVFAASCSGGSAFEVQSCSPTTGASGEPAIRCEGEYTTCPARMLTTSVCGRRPGGFDTDDVSSCSGRTSLGNLFARMARLEGASVFAFEILRRELLAHGAPDNLVRGAIRAARDEARHEHTMTALAERFGGSFLACTGTDRPLRSLEAVAIENAVEGCVRETYGALVAQWQAQSAREPAVCAVMARIAKDEAGHAALAWQIDAWVRTRLHDEARARVDAARATARDELERETAVFVSHEFTEAAGLPSRDAARRLFAAASQALWS